MGNNQSMDNKACPSSRLCRMFYLGAAPPSSEDDDEWFGVLPRERRQKKKSRSQSKLTPMPALPEETLATASIDDDITSLIPQESQIESDDLSCATPESIKEYNRWAFKRQYSVPASMKLKGTRSKSKPKVKLTFVNGQFVDLSTDEGRDIVKAALSEEDGTSIAVGGILSSVKSGHCGIIQEPSVSRRSSFSQALSGITDTSFTSTSKKSFNGLTDSDLSHASITSKDSMSTQGSASNAQSTAFDSKNAVSSIVALGNGYLLTSSNCDRVIKLWNLTSDGGKTTPQFRRDFPGSSSCCGHNTGITCLAKVDDKGRFLSASKDCVVKLWDSRFNCDDDSGDGDGRVLLANFDKIESRPIRDITIIEDGKYVRPTDNVDMTMSVCMMKKALKEGSRSVQKAARERQIIECSCKFATITAKCNVVKLWSVKHSGQVEKEGGNVSDVTMTHELKHDAVVQSITSVRGKGMILTGDSMGNVTLWKSGSNVFLPDSRCTWTCARTFSWRKNCELLCVQENFLTAITSLTFLNENMFVSGSRSGILRVWKVDGTKSNGETFTKEDICINGAHNLSVTAVRQVRSRDSNAVSFSSASEDGKVLSFTFPVDGGRNPRCFNVVNHGITNRYFPDADRVGVVSLCCLIDPNNIEDVLVTGTTSSNGFFHVLRPPKQGMQEDALVVHRQSILEESLTIFDVAEKISKEVESKNRTRYMKSYSDCFLGKDVVSYLVDHKYAASQKDAVDLGRVLASHLSLFECVSKKGKLLVDDAKSFYRFSNSLLGTSSTRRLSSD